MNRLVPRSDEELSEIVRDAQTLRQNIVPVGGGLSLGTANITPDPDILIDMTQCSGISDYVASDLTLRVGAGTRFSELQSALAEHGQEIPIDVPFPGTATVGGVVATGFAGPRRLSSGTMKDLLIGCTFVRGDGLAAKAGGMVVKNVSGFEIPRLLHGSWGALAIITSVNLKVLPRPRAASTLIADLGTHSLEDSLFQIQKVLFSVAEISAATVERRDGNVQAALRVTGREPAVAATIADCRIALDGRATDIITGDADKAFWQEQTDRWSASGDDRVQVAFGMPPAQLGENLKSLSSLVGAAFDGADLLIQPGTGAMRASFCMELDAIRAWWTMREHLAIDDRAAALVEMAPAGWREGINVWGADTPARELMRDVKTAFDPEHVLNRGRLFV